MLKIPYGQCNYESLKEENYYYVDKTMYLEKLESVSKNVVYLRPRRFGKSLFTSMMYYYYDVNSKSLFDTLFKDTYVYNNPTINKNNYYVLRFDFSGLSNKGVNNDQLNILENAFNKRVVFGIEEFIDKYNLDINIDSNQSANDYIFEFLSLFSRLNLENKIYIIIDEYDNFTNSILSGDGNLFKDITGDNGFLKNFYAEIKKRTLDGVVDRVFITGVCSITIDSMTSGFNIATNITNDFEFNSMIGLTHEEVRNLINTIEEDKDKQDNIYNTMLENYDGYLFNEKLKEDDKVFNSTLVMYYLNYYSRTHLDPDSLIDSNIVSSFDKIKNVLTLKDNPYYLDILKDILDDNEIESNIITNFDLTKELSKDDIISLLYYFGYLTIGKMSPFGTVFRMPNKVIIDLYVEYFKEILDNKVTIDDNILKGSLTELMNEGKIDKITSYVSDRLRECENRIFTKFDEKYIQMMYFTLLSIKGNAYSVYNEYLTNGGYTDLYIKSNSSLCKNDIMIELKYIKKNEYSDNLLDIRIKEGTEQIDRYIIDKRIDTGKLKKYVVVFVKDVVKKIIEIN